MTSNGFQTPWTDEVTAFMRERALAGDTATEIAAAANAKFRTTLTRNAVCGKLDRMKITRPPKPRQPKREPQQRRQLNPRIIVKRAPPAAPEPGSGAITIFDLRSIDQCRYIMAGEGRAAQYCGSLTREGSSWCPYHHSKCTYMAAS